MKTRISIRILFLFFFLTNSLFSQVIVNDEFFNLQWYLNMTGNDNTRADIRIIDAWTRTMGNSNQNIADIEGDDGGENGYPLTTHTDLLGRITKRGSGITGDHSTRIAGLIVANHNSIGIAGVNKYAHLNTYLFASDDEEQWADKIRDARLDGNKIINISQGLYDPLPNVSYQLSLAYINNIVTVVSVGNSGVSYLTNPAPLPTVIAVGSSTKDNTSSSWSNSGSQIEFLAPGGTDFTLTNPKNIYSTSFDGNYNYKSGTSNAAPLVAGAASLLLAYKPDLTNEDVKNILINSCDKLEEMNGESFNNKCGYGRINLKKAMELLESPYSLVHGNTTLTKLYDNIRMAFTDDPILPFGVYFGDAYKLSIDRDNINYLETPMAWLPKGYSPNFPNDSQDYLYSSTTKTSFHAYTYFYYIRYDEVGNPINLWVPYNPNGLLYTILGKSAIINVPEEYPTISTALAATVPGQTVNVTGQQTITNDLTVPSGVKLKLNSGSTLTFNSGKKIMAIGGGNITASNTTFQGNGTAGYWYAIMFYANTSGTIQSCTIKDAVCGIYCAQVTNLTVSNSTIRNNSLYGFSIISSSSPTISNCIIQNNGTGISSSSSRPAITGCTIENNTNYGISANNIDNYYPHLFWYDNTFSGNGYAMLLNNASPYIYNSTISDNYHGITITSGLPNFADPSNQWRGYNAITCNMAIPNFKADNYSTVYAGYGPSGGEDSGGYNSIFGSELPDMEASNNSDILACNNYWGIYSSPAIWADATSTILAWYPLSSDPNPGSCSLYKSPSLAKNSSSTEESNLSEKYLEAIASGYKNDFNTAKNLLKSLIEDKFDSKYSPLALLTYYNLDSKDKELNGTNVVYSLDDILKNVYNRSKEDPLRPFAVRLLAREAALQNKTDEMIAYNTEIIENYPNSSQEVSALYDLVNYYYEIEEDNVTANKYLKKMAEAYPDNDLTLFAKVNLGLTSFDLKKSEGMSIEQIPNTYSLEDNFPNPFNPTTTISYSIPNDEKVVLKVYDIIGSEITTLVNEEKAAGKYEVNFDASSLSSGVYIYKIQAGSFVSSKKMLLLK